MKIAIGTDHAGFEFRATLLDKVTAPGHHVDLVGAQSKESYDYPDAADAVVQKVLASDADLGILICGTGIGMSIRANRYPGIRAALCCSPQMAALAREHNHANVLCIGARMVDAEEASAIVEAFLEGRESREPRHLHRVELLDASVDMKGGAVGC